MRKVAVPVVLIVSLLLGFTDASPVYAQGGNFLDNLFNGGQRARERRTAVAARRQENRGIQSALNFFGFDVGNVDGVLGKKSRAAVSALQQALNLPETGILTDEQQIFLLESEDRIIAGGDDMNWRILANFEGTLGLLKYFYLEENPFAEIEAQPVEPIQPSMRAFCAKIGTSNPVELVKAHFCNYRQLSIEQAEFLAKTSPTPQSLEDVAAQCENFASAMRDVTQNLYLVAPETALQELEMWSISTGLPPETLSRIAETCLGSGFARDDMTVSLASAYAIAGLGDATYIEMVGYHLAFGLGFDGEKDFAKAIGWLEIAADKFETGDPTITGQTGVERSEIVMDIAGFLVLED